MEPRPNKLTAAREAMPYAVAAFRRAQESLTVKDWEDKLQVLAEVIKQPDIDKILRDPRLKPEQLEQIMGAVMDKLEMEGDQRDLIRIMIKDKKLSLMPWVFDGFVKERKKADGYTEVRIITALPISEAQLSNLTEAISKKFNIKAAPTVETDPALIGGVKIIIGDRVIDQSMQGQLERLKRHLGKPPAP